MAKSRYNVFCRYMKLLTINLFLTKDANAACPVNLCKWNLTPPAAVADWQCYLNRYPDLRAFFGSTNLISA